MLRQLTAWMLALLIASPMCWCGWMHEAQAQAAAKPGCCQEREEAGHSTAPQDSKDCPCSVAPKARDVAASKITVPPVPVTGEWLATWNPVQLELAHRDAGVQPDVEFLEHGPPPRALRLWVLDCALLI